MIAHMLPGEGQYNWGMHASCRECEYAYARERTYVKLPHLTHSTTDKAPLAVQLGFAIWFALKVNISAQGS